jgi:hypothetical protein
MACIKIKAIALDAIFLDVRHYFIEKSGAAAHVLEIGYDEVPTVQACAKNSAR